MDLSGESGGMILDTNSFKAENWEGARGKESPRLSKWNWLLSQSYRRVPVAINLVASTLWRRLIALTPRSGVVTYSLQLSNCQKAPL